MGLALAGGHLYVADCGNSTVRAVDPYAPGGAVVTTLAGSAGVTGHADGKGTGATFNYPRGVATDGTYVYVADTGNNTIRKVAIATGVVATLAGSATAYAGYVDGAGPAARFSGPSGIVLANGKLFVADKENSAIRVVDPVTGETATLAARASRPAGITASGAFLYYTNIATAPGGAVFPGDGNTLTEVNLLTGDAVSIAGGNVDRVSADGTGAAASFNHPEAVHAFGSTLYVADTLSDLVRKVTVRMD
jgi:sugar lactone lactonase YvrE